MKPLSRREWAVGLGLGGAALATGAWLRGRQPPVQVGDQAAAAASAAGVALPPLRPLPTPLTTLDGRTLANADIGQRALVLNFWAPWCGPCVHEMPELDRFARSEAGRDALVIGLAIDEEPKVREFLGRHPVSFPISVLGYGGLAWLHRLSNDQNTGLPFTAVFDRSGRLAQHRSGATNAAELAGWVHVS